MAEIIGGIELFAQGDIVPMTGQYVLTDEHAHRQNYRVVLEEGDLFPTQTDPRFFYTFNDDGLAIDSEVKSDWNA